MKTVLLTLPLSAINHLLDQEPWAMNALQPHAKKIACIDFHWFSVRFSITTHGLLAPAPDNDAANVTIHINPIDIPLILQNKERAISYVKLKGDADLAHTLSDLAANLRWDAEHELSQWFGDIAARRLVYAGKASINVVKSNAWKIQENVAEYFLEENPMLMRPEPISEFTHDVERLRNDVERLQKRVEKCEKMLRSKSIA